MGSSVDGGNLGSTAKGLACSSCWQHPAMSGGAGCSQEAQRRESQHSAGAEANAGASIAKTKQTNMLAAAKRNERTCNTYVTLHEVMKKSNIAGGTQRPLGQAGG